MKIRSLTILTILIILLHSNILRGQIKINPRLVRIAQSKHPSDGNTNYFTSDKNCDCYYDSKRTQFEISWGFRDGLQEKSYLLTFTKRSSAVVYNSFTDVGTDPGTMNQQHAANLSDLIFSTDPFKLKPFSLAYRLNRAAKNGRIDSSGTVFCKNITFYRKKTSFSQQDYTELMNAYLHSAEFKKALSDKRIKTPIYYQFKSTDDRFEYKSKDLHILKNDNQYPGKGTVITIGYTPSYELKAYTVRIVSTFSTSKPLYKGFYSFTQYKKNEWTPTDEFHYWLDLKK